MEEVINGYISWNRQAKTGPIWNASYLWLCCNSALSAGSPVRWVIYNIICLFGCKHSTNNKAIDKYIVTGSLPLTYMYMYTYFELQMVKVEGFPYRNAVWPFALPCTQVACVDRFCQISIKTFLQVYNRMFKYNHRSRNQPKSIWVDRGNNTMLKKTTLKITDVSNAYSASVKVYFRLWTLLKFLH